MKLCCPFCSCKDIFDHILESICSNCLSRSKIWNTRHPQWISVKDKLPEKDGSYLVIINKYHPYNNKEITDTFMKVDLFVKNLFHKELPGASLYGRNDVTHWMHLPSLPEKK